MSPRPHFPASRASIIQPLSSRPHSGFGGLQHPLRTPLLSMATLPSAAVQLSKPNASCHSLPFAAIRRTVSPTSSSREAYPVQLRAEHLHARAAYLCSFAPNVLNGSRRISVQLRAEPLSMLRAAYLAASCRASLLGHILPACDPARAFRVQDFASAAVESAMHQYRCASTVVTQHGGSGQVASNSIFIRAVNADSGPLAPHLSG